MTRAADGIPDDLLMAAAGDLRLLANDRRHLSANGEEDVNFILDRAIHDIAWPRARWIELLCDGEVGSFPAEDHAYLAAHREPVFSLYEVLETRGSARVRLRDLLRGGDLWLMDAGMNFSSRPGQLIAIRVIAREGMNFTSGVAIPLNPEQKKHLVDNFTWLYDQKKSKMTWDQMMRRYAPRFYLEYKGSGQKIIFL